MGSFEEMFGSYEERRDRYAEAARNGGVDEPTVCYRAGCGYEMGAIDRERQYWRCPAEHACHISQYDRLRQSGG